jgi:uncharacterized membrane protein HdeD (DUF308 family)
MEAQTTQHGVGLALRGVLATVFGIAAVFWPGITLVTLVYLFSTFVLLNGLVDLVFGVSRLSSGTTSVLTRVLTLLFGILQLGVGVYLLRHPGVSFATLILLIGFTLILRGVFGLMEALFEEGPSLNRLLIIIMGLISVVAGVVVLFQPASAGVAFVWIVGLFALVTGPLLIALSVEIDRALKVPAGRR